MNCRELQILISANLDGYASGHEAAAVEEHLISCASCRRQAKQLRCVRSEMRTLRHLPVSEELSASTVLALRKEARQEARRARIRADQLAIWRVRLLSQSVGTVVSCVLFVMLASAVFRPAYRALALASAVVQVAAGEDETDTTRQLTLLLDPPPPPPVFSPSGALLGFSKSLSEGDEFLAAVKVMRDGRASVQVVEPARDPSLVNRLGDALFHQASFQPLRRARSIASDAVLMFSKVNVPG